MYEPVYSTYCGKIGNGRDLSVAIAPCFGTDFTKYEGWKIYWGMEGKTMKDESFEKKEILIVSEAQWVVEVDNHRDFHVTVTEYTKTLRTPLGEEMNKIINQKVKEAQKDYQKRKRTEKRLYFYDEVKGNLEPYIMSGSSWDNDGLQYRLTRGFTTYQKIDVRCPTPYESCFILGKVRRTIGTKDGKLMDFIEPVAEFQLDEEEDYFCDWANCLGDKIFSMLQFSIQKEEPTDDLTVSRIKSKMHCNVQMFLKMLNKALEAGDVEKVKEFYNVIHTLQDCSKEKFQILKGILEEPLEKEKEICCYPSIELWIKYENGEQEEKPASWIAENISRCTNKEVTYLEKVEKYKFY